MNRACVATLVALVLSAPARASAAPPDAKEACATAYEQSQRLRQRGSLRAARRELLVCSRSPCAAIMHSDCTRWLAEVDAMMPTIVVRASAGSDDIVDARVSIDGTPLADRIDGLPIALDPGEHTIVVEWAQKTEQRRVVLAAGEKARAVPFVFEPARVGPPEALPPKARSEPETRAARPVPWTVFGTAGLSALAFGSFAFFAVDGAGKLDDLDRSGCRPFCNAADVQAVDRAALVADVSLVVGILAAGASVLLYLTRPTVEVAATR